MIRRRPNLAPAAFLVAATAVPGLARADMTCIEFNGMDRKAQAEILGSMAEAGEAGMSASGAMTTGEGEDAAALASDDLVRAVDAACRRNPGAPLAEAVAAPTR
jgi:hypothetical protein